MTLLKRTSRPRCLAPPTCKGKGDQHLELILVRHGQTEANMESRFQGLIDYELSSKGEEEALKIARRLSSCKLNFIYSSPLKRALHTANIIAERHRLKVKVLPSLIEFSWGIIEGLTWPEIIKRHPELASRLKKDLQHTPIPRQEPSDLFWQRIYRNIEYLCQNHSRDTVLLVSHGRFLNAFLTGFLNMDPQGSWPFRFSPGSVSILEVNREGRRSVKLFNDSCHLLG